MGLRRLSSLDTLLLAADGPTTAMHVTAVLLLDPATVPGGWSVGCLRAFLADRLHLVPPLRRRIVEVPGRLARPYWLDVPGVDVADHVHAAPLPEPRGLREVTALAGRVHGRLLDRDRPLWEMHVTDPLADGRVAVVAKVHHALMDGVAGMAFMASLFSTAPAVEPPAPAPEPDVPPDAPSALEVLARSVPDVLALPGRAGRVGASIAWSLARAARFLGSPHGPVGFPPAAPRLAWNGPITPERAVALASVPLAEVKRIGRAHDATVNEVLLAVVAGALRGYLRERGALPERPLAAAVPIELHGSGNGAANAVSMMLAVLPTDVADAGARLAAARDAAREGRRLHDAMGGGAVMTDWSAGAPPLAVTMAVGAYARFGLAARIPLLANIVVSNVAGPPVPLYFAGARLLAVHPLGPVFDGLGLNLTVVSCEDDIGFGFVTCPAVLPDVEELAASVPPALAAYADGLPSRAAGG